MPSISRTVGSVSLSSSWSGVKRQYTDSTGTHTTIQYTTPTTAYDSRTFDLTGIPAGATVNSATLSCTRWGSGAVRTMDGVNADSVSISPSRITPGGSLSIAFSYRATAGGTPAGAVGTVTDFSATAGWNNPTLTVDYTEPYTAPTAPASVTISKGTAAPGEALILSWSGARAGSNVSISGYEVYRAEQLKGAYTPLMQVEAAVLSLAVAAPLETGSYYYKVKTLGNRSGYNSDLSSAYAAVSVVMTAPTPPTLVTVSPTSAPPETAAVLSWSGAAAGENSPLVGYDVYCAPAESGPYSKLLAVESAETGGTASVQAPTGDSLYFKVVARSNGSSSGLSAAYAALTADLSGTSDYALAQEMVDAGTALCLTLLSNTDKAHTLEASMGEFTQSVSYGTGAESMAFTPPLAWLSAMPESDTGPLTLRLSTAGGGSITKTAYLRCPEDVGPSLAGAQAQPVSDTVPQAWNCYVAGKSRAQITLTAAAQPAYGAPIRAYRLSGCGAQAEGESPPLSALTELLPAGEQTVEVTAVDARGRIGTQRLRLDVQPYEAPALSGLFTRRCQENGTEDDEGVYARAQATLLFSSCAGGNSAGCAIHYRKQGTEQWQNAGMLSDGTLIFGGGLSPAANWETRYTVTDALGGQAVFYDILPRAVWELHVKRGGGAWAFGGVANVDGALKIYGDLQVEGITRSGGLFSYDETTNTLTIAQREGTFHFDADTGTLAITD